MNKASGQSKKINHIRKRSDFLRVKQAKIKFVAPRLIIELCPNQLDYVRRGITVSARVDKRAVIRNRLKRRLRAAFADIIQMPDYHIMLKGYDVVLIGRKYGINCDYTDLKRDIIKGLTVLLKSSQLNE